MQAAAGTTRDVSTEDARVAGALGLCRHTLLRGGERGPAGLAAPIVLMFVYVSGVRTSESRTVVYALRLGFILPLFLQDGVSWKFTVPRRALGLRGGSG